MCGSLRMAGCEGKGQDEERERERERELRTDGSVIAQILTIMHACMHACLHVIPFPPSYHGEQPVSCNEAAISVSIKAGKSHCRSLRGKR